MTFDEFRATTRFPALDGLRALAAAMVIFYHYGGPEWEWLTGWIGVHVFFVLSGFLITTLALREESRRGRVSLPDFFIRRTLRIVPVYAVVLGVLVGVVTLRGEWEASGLGPLMPYYLTFTGELLGPGEPHGHVWTLGIEQKFYLLWPLLAFPVALAVAVRLGITAVLLAVLLALSATQPVFVSYVPIAVGCVVAIVLHSRRGFAVLGTLAHPVVATVLGLAFVALHLALPGIERDLGVAGTVLVYTVPVALFVVTLLGRGPFGLLLGVRPLRFVGDRSYSLYLAQDLGAMVAIAVVPEYAELSTATAVAALVTGLLLADVLYRGVELPFIALGRRWIARRAGARPPPPVLGQPAAVG